MLAGDARDAKKKKEKRKKDGPHGRGASRAIFKNLQLSLGLKTMAIRSYSYIFSGLYRGRHAVTWRCLFWNILALPVPLVPGNNCPSISTSQDLRKPCTCWEPGLWECCPPIEWETLDAVVLELGLGRWSSITLLSCWNVCILVINIPLHGLYRPQSLSTQ